MRAPSFFELLLKGLSTRINLKKPRTITKSLSVTERWAKYCKENPGAEECRIYDT